MKEQNALKTQRAFRDTQDVFYGTIVQEIISQFMGNFIWECNLKETDVKGLSYSYFSVFGILILIFDMFFLYTRTFQK